MARKRKIFDNNLSRENKKPSPDSKNENAAEKVNLLNDKLLSLYKKDISAKLDSPVAVLNDTKRNLDESNCNSSTEENSKVEDIEKAKTAGKTPKKIYQVKRNTVLTLKHSSLTFDDVGGMDKSLMEVLQLFIHLKSPQLFEAMGVRPVRGFLLHGPPGCGKTHLARATAGELSLPYIEVAATELVCGISGESESKIRDMFEESIKSAPCILFIDEIDAVSPKRDTADKGMEKRMVAQLLKCLDELNEKDAVSHVMVIGATNRPDSIDPALRRGGRFDREIAIGMPDEKARFNILEVLCKNLKLAPEFDLNWLAHHTPGYVGADLKSLITEAVKIGIWRICKRLISSTVQENKVDCDGEGGEAPLPDINVDLETELPLLAVRQWFKTKSTVFDEQTENLYFEQSDFKAAIQNCVPYSKREGFASVPNVTWDDVGGLADVQKKLITSILWPVKYPKIYEKNNITSSKGILLYGPKGCGKTLLAKAIANECSINFLSVKGPELLSMYLGESEKAVRQCFQRARNSAPCVIFFDELDALCPTRSGSNVNAAAERVVNQLLTEMDGMEPRHQVFVIGATNRMEKIDSAMLRPGRLEKRIFVDIPSPAGRVEILKSITKNKTAPKMSDDIKLETVGLDSRCSGFSGADLAYLVREAFFKAMDDQISSTSFVSEIEIKMEHFEYAFGVVKPSIEEKDLKYFRNHPVHNLGT
ncbi:nuclear valosin-containing protein-like [Uloborus diversus]|uniref:nuclear valosin-containing protein-like n=1 Tax=Uloborus diversus TaxID=327109 RepID=UPI00240A8D13|nr:nuclear valosin-containing protein-like [Uloborus diversus]